LDLAVRCGYCQFAHPFVGKAAKYIINGQSVCDEHVNTATADFGRSLLQLQKEQEGGDV
jgi:hypothetical protein